MDTSLATSFVSQSGILINVSNPNDVCYFDNKIYREKQKNNKLEKNL